MAGIIELIGNTPLAEIQRLNPNPNVRIFCQVRGQQSRWQCKGPCRAQHDPQRDGTGRYHQEFQTDRSYQW